MTRDLQRFVDAQQDVIDGALRELRAGRKAGHWIWFVFPQVAGLGRSELSRHYAISSWARAGSISITRSWASACARQPGPCCP